MCRGVKCSGKRIFSVSRETLEKTTGCDTKGCLSGKEIMCPVEKAITTEVLFVHYDPSKCTCIYHLPFGDSSVCMCPTRQEIFRKYEK